MPLFAARVDYSDGDEGVVLVEGHSKGDVYDQLADNPEVVTVRKVWLIITSADE